MPKKTLKPKPQPAPKPAAEEKAPLNFPVADLTGKAYPQTAHLGSHEAPKQNEPA